MNGTQESDEALAKIETVEESNKSSDLKEQITPAGIREIDDNVNPSILSVEL